MTKARQHDRRAGLSKTLLIAGVVVVLGSVGLGLGLAFVLTAGAKTPAQEAAVAQAAAASPEFEYVPFGSVVVNLSEGRLTRYLQVKTILKARPDCAQRLRERFDGGEKAIFQNWLITYLSDKRLDEVGGAAAIARLQREIQDGFNAILAQSGKDKVEAVLFEEFNIQ